MHGTQKVVSAVVGLVIVVGGYGCRQLAAESTEEVADRITAEAVDEVDGVDEWDGPTGSITDEEGTSIITGGADAEEEVDLPEGWPTGLEVVEGLDVLYTTADPAGLNVTGNLDDEVVLVTPDVKDALATAGFTVDDEQLRTEADGRAVATVRATGPGQTATVTITETPEDPHGSLTIVYLLVPAG